MGSRGEAQNRVTQKEQALEGPEGKGRVWQRPVQGFESCLHPGQPPATAGGAQLTSLPRSLLHSDPPAALTGPYPGRVPRELGRVRADHRLKREPLTLINKGGHGGSWEKNELASGFPLGPGLGLLDEGGAFPAVGRFIYLFFLQAAKSPNRFPTQSRGKLRV